MAAYEFPLADGCVDLIFMSQVYHHLPDPTLRDVSLEISAAALLTGKAHIRSLTIAEVDMTRSSTAPSTTPFLDYLKVPHLPIPVALDRLSISELALAPPVLGENILATVEGSATLAGGRAHIALDLHRIDNSAGNILLAMEIAGPTPVLNLQLDATEPTGVVLDRLLGRVDRLPLALSLNGSGPVADWHGRLKASAGMSAHLAADLTLAAADETVLGISGTAGFAPLLPSEVAPLIGDRVALSMRTKFGELLVGFVGTDRWLRRQFRDKHDHTPLNDAEDNEVRR
jgi:translocation and assembly module TamB